MPSKLSLLTQASACVALPPLPSPLSGPPTPANASCLPSRLASRRPATPAVPAPRPRPPALRTAASLSSFPAPRPRPPALRTAASLSSFPAGGPSDPSPLEETIWSQIRDLLGHSGNDPGHWNHSPEWWGSQDGGWGRNDGITVFSKESAFNGTVEVTAHPASLGGFASEGRGDEAAAGDETRQEWRVLRFNRVTRQSVARVAVGSGVADSSLRRDLQQRRELEGGQTLAQQPDCLASEYLKSIAAVAAALAGLLDLVGEGEGGAGRRPLRALCVGLGGGSLPLFLAHHFPGAVVDAVELDPVVVEAAVAAMGLPADAPALRLHTRDGVQFLAGRAAEIRARGGSDTGSDLQYDLIFVDAFDGGDNVPPAVCSPGFAADLGAALRPDRGAVLMNFHSTDVRDVADAFFDAIVGDRGSGDGGGGGRGGCCFTVTTQKQHNLTLVTARGVELPAEPEAAQERLHLAAVMVAHTMRYPFPAGSRSGRGYARLR